MNYTIEVNNTTTSLLNNKGELVWEFIEANHISNLAGAGQLIERKAQPNSEAIVLWLLDLYLQSRVFTERTTRYAWFSVDRAPSTW